MNVHRYELIRLARVRIAYLDPGLHLVSTLHSLGFFLHPDSSVHLCSPALALAHSNSRPDSSIHPCSLGGKCPHSLGFFLCPDSSIHLCSPALALAHSNSRPDSSVHPCSLGGKCPHSLGFFLRPDLSIHLCSPALTLTHLDPFCILPCLSMRALQEVSASLTQILSVS